MGWTNVESNVNMNFSDPSAVAGMTEHSQQCALLSACAQLAEVNPQLKWLFAIPNGGDRDMRTAGNLKAEGVKAGVADLCLPCARRGWHGFFIEMKKPTGGSQSSKQLEFEGFVTQEGYLYAVFHNWIDALNGLLWYLDIDPTELPFSWISRLDQKLTQ